MVVKIVAVVVAMAVVSGRVVVGLKIVVVTATVGEPIVVVVKKVRVVHVVVTPVACGTMPAGASPGANALAVATKRLSTTSTSMTVWVFKATLRIRSVRSMI